MVDLPESVLLSTNYWIALILQKNQPPPSGACKYGLVEKCVWLDEKGTWKYRDSGTAPVDFASPSFEDLSWKQGQAEFGFGDPKDRKEATVIEKGHTAYYFRKEITISDATCYRSLPATLHILYDDGFIVYVNGREVLRRNLPSGPVTSSTWATTWSKTEWFYDEIETTVPLKMLSEGRNVIAVEVHQFEQDATYEYDLSFDMFIELTKALNCKSQLPSSVPSQRTCKELGRHFKSRVDSGICMSSMYPGNGTCLPATSYQSAWWTCREIGARLCTADELRSGRRTSWGFHRCMGSAKAMWTSSECTHGHEGLGFRSSSCSFHDELLSTRCCADT